MKKGLVVIVQEFEYFYEYARLFLISVSTVVRLLQGSVHVQNVALNMKSIHVFSKL